MAAGVGDGGRSEGSGGLGDGDAVDTCDAADGTGEGDAAGRVEGEEEEGAGGEAGAGEDGGGRTAATTAGSACSRAPPMIAAAVTPPAQTSAATASRTRRTGMPHRCAIATGLRPDFRRRTTAVDLILDEGERGRGR